MLFELTNNQQFLMHSFGNVVAIFLLTVIGTLSIYHFWLQSTRYVRLGNKIPGLTPLPFIGSIHLALWKGPTEIMQYALKVAQESGPVVRLWVGSRLFVALTDPQDIEVILGSNVHLKKSPEYNFFQPWLGDGLLISKGERWRSHRKMIAPTFHSSILKTFLPVFNKNAAQLNAALKKEVGQVFDVHEYMSGTTVDILLETAMGVKKTDQDNTGLDYALAVMKMCNILHLRHYKVWLRSDFIFSLTQMAKMQKSLLNTIHSLTRRVIKRKKEDFVQRQKLGEESLYNAAMRETQREGGGDDSLNYGSKLRDDLDESEDNDVGEKRRLAFLDFMIEASHIDGNNLSDRDIKEEVDTIMFEGHDTTAAGSSFVLCLLANHTAVQERVVEELKQILGNSDRPITFMDTVNMKYLERVILETLRLYPPVPMISRSIDYDVQLESGDYVLPKGTTVIIGTYAVHRNPKFYPNPAAFNPDNFLPERCQSRHYYSFIPFSAGPRSCVGRKYAMLKLKVVLASVLRKYKILPVVEEKDYKLQADIILKRSDGFRITIEERN